jgi:hypothetical protein
VVGSASVLALFSGNLVGYWVHASGWLFTALFDSPRAGVEMQRLFQAGLVLLGKGHSVDSAIQ